MQREQQKRSDELLTLFRDAIRQGTRGHLSSLNIESAHGEIAVTATFTTYYGIQLALNSIEKFASQCSELPPSKLFFSIGGRQLILQTSVPADVGGNTNPKRSPKIEL